MVLTPRRWILLLLLACAAIAVAYLPPGDIADAQRWASYRWFSSRETPRSRLAHAAERWEALSEREALRPTPPAGDIPVLITRGELRPETARAVEVMLRSIWSRAPRADSAIRLRVVASADAETLTPLTLWTAGEHPLVLLPDQTDGHTCLVILPRIIQQRAEAGYPSGWWRNNLRRQVEWGVSPCVLRAALGVPGAEIAKWLAARGYDLGASIGWAVGGNAGVEYRGFWDERFELEHSGVMQLMQRIVGELPAAYQSVAAARCAGGVPGRCADLVLTSPPRPRESGPMIRTGFFAQWRAGGLSSDAGTFLSSLIQERGLEPSRRFWTSPLPVRDAFTAAYGISLDDWTREWMHRSVGDIELGAPTHPAGAAVGLLAALLVVGVTAAAAASRGIG